MVTRTVMHVIQKRETVSPTIAIAQATLSRCNNVIFVYPASTETLVVRCSRTTYQLEEFRRDFADTFNIYCTCRPMVQL